MPSTEAPIAVEDRLALLDRVLESKAFSRAPRLAAMLRYICEQSLDQTQVNKLNERLIGIHVFGRREDYNPMEDNIVRSTGRLLRQRLADYFDNEGRHEPLRIEIPKGKYLVEFRLAATPPTSEPLPGPAAETASLYSRRKWWGLGWGAAALATAAATRKSWLPQDHFSQFWNLLLDPQRRTIIVVADTAFILVQDLLMLEIPVSEYFRGSWRHKPGAEIGPRLFVSDIANRRYTGLVDADFAFQVARRPEAQGVDISVRFARDLNIQETRGANLLVVGSPNANPWVRLLERHGNFRMELDQQKRQFSIRNQKPQGKEKGEWVQNVPGRVYGLASLLRKPDNDGYALLLQGASIAGTECVVDLVCRPARFAGMIDRLFPGGSPLSPFEALFETTNLAGNSSPSELIASRVYPG